jgi:hypothetical protein
MSDPRNRPAFVVRVTSGEGAETAALSTALLDVPIATDEEVARLEVLDGGEQEPRGADAAVFVVRGPPTQAALERLTALATAKQPVFVAVQVASDAADAIDEVRSSWERDIDPAHVYPISEGPAGNVYGVDELRAALLRVALDAIDLPVDRARRAKRPYATAIIAGAAIVTAAEGLLPGAAAFVVATQVGALGSLYYLYTGRWLARTQALAVLPAFATEAAGGSVFLLVKSFLPPTGVADVAAAIVAASLTISMLGAVTWALEQGYSLKEKEQLALAFKRMRARSRKERARIAASRHRWNEKAFWTDLVRRVVFE